MKNKDIIKSITLGGIFAAIYAITTILSVYVINVLSVIGLMILPIFAAYYSSVFKFKYTIMFNLATLIVCFVCGIGDPFFTLLYVLPTLIVGDVFGFLNHLKIKYYTTLFLETITYSITNVLALLLGEFIYEINIIDYIILDEWISNNLSLSILFILSGAEAIFSSMFINEKLKSIHLEKKKENEVPLYCYISSTTLFSLDIVLYFIDKNVYFLLFTMCLCILIPIFNELYKNLKNKNLCLLIYIFVTASLNFLAAFLNHGYLIPLIIVFPMIIYSIVKIVIYIYNVKKKEEKK